MPKNPEHDPNQPRLFNLSVESGNMVHPGIKIGLDIMPDIVKRSKHWQTKPAGPCILADLSSNSSVLFEDTPAGWSLKSRFDYNLLPYNNIKKPKLGAVILVATEGINPEEDRDMIKKFAVELRRGKSQEDNNPGSFLALEVLNDIPDSMEIMRHRMLLETSGFVEVKYSIIPNENRLVHESKLLVWDSRLKKISRSPSEEIQLAAFGRIISDLNRRYDPYLLHVVDREQAEEKFLAKRGNYWVKQKYLRMGYGITVGGDCGCRYELDTDKWMPCRIHSEIEAPPPFTVDEPRGSYKARNLEPILSQIDARRGSDDQPTKLTCPVLECNQPLNANKRVIKVTGRGYLVSVEAHCPDHGWEYLDTILADGPDLANLTAITLIKRESKMDYL